MKEYFYKKEYKYMYMSIFFYNFANALRTNHIIERLFAPLYLYIILQDFAAFSTIIIVSLLFQIITITLIGKYTDKNLRKANNFVSAIRVAITAIYLFARNKILISANKTLSDNFEKVYETSITTSIQNIIKDSKEDNELLSTAGQMSLCFTEVIILAILSIAAKYIGTNIFYIIFASSIVSTIAINFYTKKEQQ